MADPAFSFAVLGPLHVSRDGQPVVIASGRQRTLLALLLSCDQSVSRARLIDELWGETPPPTAGKALTVFISRLRAKLGDVIVSSGSAYRLEAGDYELDAARFRTLVSRARAEPAAARDLLAEALRLFRGEPLADVDSDGLVGRWRRALEHERLEALIARVDCDLVAGLGPELVGELEALLDSHPYEERIWGQLMVALARSGRQADALEAYQRVRRLFAYELGIEPGEPVARIQAAILAGGDGWAGGAPVAPALAGSDAPADEQARARGGVPRPLGALIGREVELRELSALLGEPEPRLVTLVGGGGFGKTRLALELAHQLEGNFRDGAVFVDLGRVSDAQLVITEVAAALGARDGVPPPAVSALARALSEQQLLLILDNFEHLLPAAIDIAELLMSAPGVRALATSRTPLRIRGEYLFELEPLAVPGGDDAGALLASPAVNLFLDRGRAIDRRLPTEPESIRLIAAICRRLDGLPLAIELAAAQLRVLTLEQLLDSLEQPLMLGEHRPRDLPERQHTLERTIRWSFEMLSPPARELLLAAGVFRGGFTLEALAAVAGRAPGAELAELFDTGLIRRGGEPSRYGLLFLVQAFTRAELATSGDLDRREALHRRHFALLADAAGEQLDAGDPPGPLAERVRPDHANLRGALDGALAHGERNQALALARGVRALWYVGSLRDEGQDLIDAILGRFDLGPEDELMLLRAASFLDGVGADFVSHRSFTERLAQRARELGDLPALATSLTNLAALALNAQDRKRVAEVKPRLLELTAAEIPLRNLAFVNYTLALAEYLEGDVAAACSHASEAVALATAADHSYALGTASGLQVMLGWIRDGTMGRAQLSEVLATMQLAPVKPLAVFALWLVARYAAAVDREAAIHWLGSAERIFVGLDAQIWPESDVRTETMAVLGLDAIEPVPDDDFLVTLAAAAAWLEARDPAEILAR